jgi:hypothetical protein
VIEEPTIQRLIAVAIMVTPACEAAHREVRSGSCPAMLLAEPPSELVSYLTTARVSECDPGMVQH